MVLREIVAALGLDVRAGLASLDREVRGGYASDLMSDVLAHAHESDLWVTLQTHQNTVAVASMKALAGIELVNGRGPEDDTLARARSEMESRGVTTEPASVLFPRLRRFLRPIKPILKPLAARILHPILGKRARRSNSR